MFEEKLGIELEKEDEMECLIRGLNFVLRFAPDECYTFTDVQLDTHGLGTATKKILPTPPRDELYPFLLVNIGSGVSILKVKSEQSFERVSGTSLGGGTFWGLCKTLSKLETFDEAMDATLRGESNALDMTVGDIYGRGGYEQFDLKSSTVASSFGKVGTKPEPRSGVQDEDVARALLFMLTQNIGQLAYLNARRVETPRIYFCGNFLRRNEIASRQLAYAIDYWSKSAMQAQFFHHEGFFGALGCVLGHWGDDRKPNANASAPSSSGSASASSAVSASAIAA
jgi:pantothenate kinase